MLSTKMNRRTQVYGFCQWGKQLSNTATTLTLKLLRRKKRKFPFMQLSYQNNHTFIISSSWKNAILITWATILLHIVKLIHLKGTPVCYLAFMLLFLSKSYISCESIPCDRNHWCDPVQNACQACSECSSGMIAVRPCELHRDTICGPISDLEFDWAIAAKAEPNWKERRKNDYADEVMESNESHDILFNEHLKEDAELLDWITIALFLGAVTCLILFTIAAFILFYHMRQWRKIEQSLTSDVEELSSRFLAKLAEVQRIDAGAFLIRSSDSLIFPGYQAQYVLLPEKNLANQQRYGGNTYQPGNVYIEEN